MIGHTMDDAPLTAGRAMRNDMRDDWLTRDVWPRRILAFIIDWVLIAVLWAASAWTIGVLGILTLGIGFLLWHLLWLLPPAYFVLWLATAEAATPGQRLLGLTVRQDAALDFHASPDLRAAPDLRAVPGPSIAQAIAWTVLLFLSFSVAAGLPLLLALVTKRRRTLHDMLTGLTVVHRQALGPAGWFGFMPPQGTAP